MKIVKIYGGLGNQMFQFAFALGLRDRHPDIPVKFDLSSFGTYKLHAFELLRIFNLDLESASTSEVNELSQYFRKNLHQRLYRKFWFRRSTEWLEDPSGDFDEAVLQDRADRFYEGYWQNHRYFRHCESAVREAFRFPELSEDDRNHSLAQRLAGEKGSVSVHIRRGDYLKHKMYAGICEADYYQRAFQSINRQIQNPNYYIFSNDIAWCREHLAGLTSPEQLNFVDWNRGKDNYKDLQMMALCRHNIIANSSFSWWGAYLNRNPGRITIAPKIWLNNDCAKQICMPEWVRL